MAFSDARNERDRAEGDRSGKSSGGGGAKARDAERRNREAMSKSRGGARQSGMSSAAADYAVATGKISTPSIPAGGVAKGNYQSQVDAYNDYAKAVGKHATRGFFDKAMDFIGGGFYDPKEPMAGNPRSFAGGDFHSTTNPGSVLGGMLGMVGGPAGSLIGKVMGPGYSALGLPEVWHGGYGQPDLRNGLLGNTDNPMGGTMADIGGGHTYASGSTPGGPGGGYGGQFAGGGTGNAGQQFASNVPGVQAPRPVQAAGVQQPIGMSPFTMQGGQMNVPGPSQYGVNLPSYGYFGSPGMQKPKSAIMGGI
jgi:hypothetical protein